MSGVETKHLLTAEQMAHFVTDGFLLFDGLVPQEYNEAVYADELNWKGSGSSFWQSSDNIRAVFELPQVKGMIQSLVGVKPGYDHSFLHVVGADDPLQRKGDDRLPFFRQHAEKLLEDGEVFLCKFESQRVAHGLRYLVQ